MASPEIVTIEAEKEEVVIIASDGDAILIVDDQRGEQQIKLRIHTWPLRRASKVFNSLFGPSFAEGQNLDSQDPPEIHIQDNQDAMKIICQVLHFQNYSLPQSIEGNQLLLLAHTTDKYDLAQAMSLAMKQLLTPSDESSTLPAQLDACLFLGYHSAIYEPILEALLLHGPTPFVCFNDLHHYGAKFLSLLYVLEHQRTKLRQKISHMLDKEKEFIAACACTWAKSYAASFSRTALKAETNSESLCNVTIAQALSKLRYLVASPIPNNESKMDCLIRNKHVTPDLFRAKWISKLNSLEHDHPSWCDLIACYYR